MQCFVYLVQNILPQQVTRRSNISCRSMLNLDYLERYQVNKTNEYKPHYLKDIDRIGDVCLQFLSSPKLLYISSMKPSQNRTTIFKLIVLGKEIHAEFEERENRKS